jgi:hypothetical protein
MLSFRRRCMNSVHHLFEPTGSRVVHGPPLTCPIWGGSQANPLSQGLLPVWQQTDCHPADIYIFLKKEKKKKMKREMF